MPAAHTGLKSKLRVCSKMWAVLVLLLEQTELCADCRPKRANAGCVLVGDGSLALSFDLGALVPGGPTSRGEPQPGGMRGLG